MTICPIAIAFGCKKCPAFKFCPLTTVLGDQAVGAWEEDLPTADEHLDKIEDEYQKYTEEELKKIKTKSLKKNNR